MSFWLMALALVLVGLCVAAFIMSVPLVWGWARRVRDREIDTEELP